MAAAVSRRVPTSAVHQSTWKGDLLAACWAGASAVASHRSAAELHGLAGRPAGSARDHVSPMAPRPLGATLRGARDARHSSRCDVTVVDGIPVTTPDRTLFDLGGVVPQGDARARARKCTSTRLRDRTGARRARQARRADRVVPVRPILRELLAARAPDRRPTESDMETLLAAGCSALTVCRCPSRSSRCGDGAYRVGRDRRRLPGAQDRDRVRLGRSSTPASRPTRRDRARRHELVAGELAPDRRRTGTTSAPAEPRRAPRSLRRFATVDPPVA